VEAEVSVRAGMREGGRQWKLLRLERREEIRLSARGCGGVNRGRQSETVGVPGRRKGGALRAVGMGDRARWAGDLGAQRALGNFPSRPWPDLGAGYTVGVGQAQLILLPLFQ
jgi:hypothetical protein